MINQRPASLPCDNALNEAALVLGGYTVSSRGRCMTRIGPEFVLRDGAHRCIRIPVATTDAVVLGAVWAQFGRPTSEIGGRKGADDTAGRGTVHPQDAALVLQGYTTSTHGVCLVRVAGHYVTRDGVRRCIRFLVDTVDPVQLGAAWAAFSGAAGWMHATSGVRLETLNLPAESWADTDEEHRASG
jgi:hypothetical protein